MMDLRPSISSCLFCTKPFKSAGAFANHLEKMPSGQSLPVELPVKRKQAISSDEKSSETDSRKENNIHERIDFVLGSPFANYSELGLIPLGLMDSRPSISACPFCNRPFKSPGAFPTHLEKRRPGQSLPIKQSQATSNNDHNSETASLKEYSGEVNMRETLCSLFADYRELSDFIPPSSDVDKDERREKMPYSNESLIGDRVKDSSDTNSLLNDTIHLPVDREAGKVVALYLSKSLEIQDTISFDLIKT